MTNATPLNNNDATEIKDLFEREANRKIADGWERDDALERAAQIAGDEANTRLIEDSESAYESLNEWIEQLIENC